MGAAGIPASGKSSNRLDEHLAIALYHRCGAPGAMHLLEDRRLEILDYQVPLKATRSDGAVGKVDLLGLTDDERLAVLELKVRGGDTPVAATLEALVYAAILEAILEDIGRELESKGYRRPKLHRPDIVVLGPVDYWQGFDKYDESWLGKIGPILTRLANSLSIEIQYLKLETGALEMGLGGMPPRLNGELKITSLFCSTAPSEPIHDLPIP